jgi:putative transposase
MSEYRRLYLPGSTIFLTIVTYNRQPIFANSENIILLRKALAKTRSEKPFEITAAAILPDHLHFLWTLHPDYYNYSYLVSRLKVLFTRSLKDKKYQSENISHSRIKHRESDVWQRRFWEHTVKDESEFENFLNYIHYNPVKHGLVSCPHFWQYSSFQTWVNKGIYQHDWACICHDKKPKIPDFSKIIDYTGE